VRPPGAVSLMGGVNSEEWNLPGSKVTWPEVKCSSIRRTCIDDLGCVIIRTCNLFVSGPKFTKFFWFNAGEMAVDQVCYRFSVCRSAPDISAVKVWSCPKSRQILNLGRSTSASITFLLVNRSSLIFFSNAAGTALDNVFVLLSISWLDLEIFAVKFESCPKSRQILDVYCLPKF